MGHFGDESFQAINCTGTDNQKQSNTTLHTPETQKRNRQNFPSNKTIYTLIWYGFYNLQSGNGVGPILTAPEPKQGADPQNKPINCSYESTDIDRQTM